jgi:hypothetical protein
LLYRHQHLLLVALQTPALWLVALPTPALLPDWIYVTQAVLLDLRQQLA